MKKAMMFIVPAIVLVFFCANSCASSRQEQRDVDDMASQIEMCEQVIDSLATRCPFEDTVMEGDDYSFLNEAHKAFEEAEEYETTKMAYKQYMRYFWRVLNQTIEQINSKAVSDFEDALPRHICDKGA